jgi:methyl-accepting chemotaxis protein/methyl-accepting chemotaxis protein-1 (serine sensor receptor)
MKERTLTFGLKMGISTGILGVVIVLLALVGLQALGTTDDAFRRMVEVDARTVRLAGKLNTAESDMAVGQRGLILFTYAKNPAGVTAAQTLFQESSADFQSALAEVRPLLVTDRGKEVTADMERRIAEWLPAYADMRRLAESGDPDGAARVLGERITAHYLAIGKDAQELAKLVEDLMQKEQAASLDRLATTRWMMVLLIALGAVAGFFAVWLMRSTSAELRRVATEMLEGSRQVSAAASQVASSSQSLAQGTSEQAATLEETSSSATEITAITRKNAENTRTANGLMAETANVVGGANHNLEEMIHSMTEINASSEKISKIIRVIDEIAFQTNILALNAAVEAARAGEAGMGFAVVADEVRNLAHRSAQAAKDTAGLIEESIGKSNEGSRKLDLVAKSIQQITGSATQVKTLVDEIDVGSQEQSRGIEQISMAVNQMEKVTQRNAANAEESAAASEELAAQARSLYEAVERLRRISGTGAANERAESPLRPCTDPRDPTTRLSMRRSDKPGRQRGTRSRSMTPNRDLKRFSDAHSGGRPGGRPRRRVGRVHPARRRGGRNRAADRSPAAGARQRGNTGGNAAGRLAAARRGHRAHRRFRARKP